MEICLFVYEDLQGNEISELKKGTTLQINTYANELNLKFKNIKVYEINVNNAQSI